MCVWGGFGGAAVGFIVLNQSFRVKSFRQKLMREVIGGKQLLFYGGSTAWVAVGKGALGGYCLFVALKSFS